MPRPEDFRHDWLYTRKAEDRYGPTYKERKLIARDSDVRGGVYYGTYHGEAIVVDPKKYPEQYQWLYEAAARRATKRGHVQRDRVLRAVFDTVRDQMPYSKKDVDKLLGRIAAKHGCRELVDGTKVDLSVFISEGAGVCRHQALACAALLETFKDNGHIRGSISVDRNQRWHPNGESDGHAWVRYTTHGGEAMILDVAQNYFGTLGDSAHKAGWNYLRPEEQRRVISPEIGDISMTDVLLLDIEKPPIARG